MRANVNAQTRLPGFGRQRDTRGPSCPRCAEPVRFLQRADGGRVVVDRRPSRLNGTLRVRKGVATAVSGRELTKARDCDEPLFVIHTETCCARQAEPGPSRQPGQLALCPRREPPPHARRVAA